MKAFSLVIVIIFNLFVSCSENSSSIKDEEKYLQIGSFNYALYPYKIKYQTQSYFILLNESDYYYLLENIGKVKGKLDYFNNRKKILENPIELDSTLFTNLKYDIIFVDSCNKKLVHEWVEKIENNPKNINQPIKVDTTVSRIDLNNIYYELINDSFKLYISDIDGNYILSR